MLRKVILDAHGVVVFGWTYLAGAPLEGQALVTADFHAQMWKHAMDFCLEWIAQKSRQQENSRVRIYLEQVGPLTSSQKGLFDDRMTSLLESCRHREGWR